MHQPVCPAEQGGGKNKIEDLVVAETCLAQRGHVVDVALGHAHRLEHAVAPTLVVPMQQEGDVAEPAQLRACLHRFDGHE